MTTVHRIIYTFAFGLYAPTVALAWASSPASGLLLFGAAVFSFVNAVRDRPEDE